MRTGRGGIIPGRQGRRLRQGLVLLIVSLLLPGVGCKGGGSSGNDAVPCTSISFTGALGSPTSGDVFLFSSGSSCDAVDISVLVTNLSGIFTVGFEINYPSSVIAYQSFSPGPLLQQGSPPIAPQFFVTNPSPGDIVVSGTLFRPDPSVSAVGNAIFITFHFVKLASGSGPLDFHTGGGGSISNQIIDENGTVVAATFGPGHGGVVEVP